MVVRNKQSKRQQRYEAKPNLGKNCAINFCGVENHFFLNVISSGKTASARGCFSAVPSHTMSRFNSWVAGMRVSFLPKETQQQPDIEPGTL